jgi:hypothetical protein
MFGGSSGNLAAVDRRHADVFSGILAIDSMQSCLSFKIIFLFSVLGLTGEIAGEVRQKARDAHAGNMVRVSGDRSSSTARPTAEILISVCHRAAITG